MLAPLTDAAGSVRIANNELVSAKFTNGETYTAETAVAGSAASDPAAISYHGHTCQFRDFIAAIREGRDPWITGEMGRIPSKDLREAEPFNAFFFAPAFAKGTSLSSLFSTHPPLEPRLEQLGRISAELGHV